MDNKKYKILIVDDEPDNLALLYRTLHSHYEVKKSLSPVEALEILKTESFNLVISDHKMPEMDGVEFLKRVYDLYPDIVRLLLTAYSDASILINSINYAKIYRYIKKPYNPDELLMIVEASLDLIKLKQENEVLISDLKDLFSGTIRAIMSALDAKDSYTVGRSRRVTYYALKMAEAIHLSDTEIVKIELAGMLHDIGMIGINDDLIYKVEPLLPQEYEDIKKHVTYSVKILDDIKQLKDVVAIVKYHHERWDGSGYPEGIAGENIPLGARIIALADAFDGMVSNRAYRDAKSFEETMQIIKSLSGSQFDPTLVDIFEKISIEAFEQVKKIEHGTVSE